MMNKKMVELKEMAKNAGFKGYSKLNKLDLVATLLAADLNTNTIEEGVVNMNNLTTRQMLSSKDKGLTKAYAKVIAIKESRKNMAAFKMIKQESKNMKVIGGYQIIAKVVLDEHNGRKQPRLVFEVVANVGLESNVIRAAGTKEIKIADKGMVLTLQGTSEVISVNLDKSLFKEDKKGSDAYKAIRTRVFRMLRRGKKGRVIRESLNLVINKINGLARVELDCNAELKENEVIKQYKMLGVTPSGLRSKSILAASVQIRTREAEESVTVDRRVHLLNESIDGGMDKFVEDGEFKELKNKAEQFKSSTRITMGSPGSKAIAEVSNYIVFNNIAAGAKFNGLNADMTCDGNISVSAEIIIAELNANGIPVSLDDVVGITDQLRGAALKCSATYGYKSDLVTLAIHLLSSKSEAFVKYAVIDGVRYNSWKEVMDAKLSRSLLSKLEMVADTNSMKLLEHNNRFELVRLKMAYNSSMNLSMVTVMAMLIANEKKAKEVILNKSIKGLAKKFGQIGLKFDCENGMINGVELDLDMLKSLNNEDQFMSYLLKCDPEMVIKLFPGVVRSELTNLIKGLAKTITKSEVELDNSTYTVVQADKAVLFGAQLLQENEIFCNSLPNEIDVAITRHPISSLDAITILTTVSLEDIVERIMALDATDDQKLFLVHYYARANQWCIIPASHRLMEKHDGMDFDIDAVQIIADIDVVEILKELNDRGSVIKDDAISNAARMTETSEEAAINAAQKNPAIGFKRPSTINEDRVTEITKSKRVNINNRISMKESITLSFNSVCSMSEDYYSTTIASVGAIANAFYVNSLVLSTLKSDTIDSKTKENIVKAFKMYYGCTGNKQYQSTIDRSECVNIYEMAKADCTDSVFRFAESNGSIDSLVEFLKDCCDYNRYPAETSIDSAKNNFYIINMFNHGAIVATKGAKHNCKATLVKADQTFADIAKELEVSQNNYFQIELLEFLSNGVELEEWIECDGKQLNEYTGLMQQVDVAIEDPLYLIKDELREVVNQLIVIACKSLEDIAMSNDACELRGDVTSYASEIVDETKSKGTAPSIEAIEHAYRTLTLGLKSNGSDNGEKTSNEIEGISKVEYMKTIATNGVKNFKKHAFNDLTSLELGALACANLISNTSEDTCGTINAALYKVCEAEMIEFLADFGLANVGFIGEAISYAELNNKKINLDEFIGQNISVTEGTAELEDGTVIVMKNRRADITGTIIDTDGHFYIKAIKEFEHSSEDAGIYINVNQLFDKYCTDIESFQAVSYKFKSTHQINKSTKGFYSIIGVNAEGQEALIACLSGREDICKLLEKVDLSTISIFANKTKNENISRVLFIPGAQYSEALNKEDVVSEFEGFIFTEPVSANYYASMYSSDQEAAIESDDNSFEGFDFGLPC